MADMLSISTFGGTPDGKILRYVTATAGSATLTAPTPDFDSSDVGKIIVVANAGANGAKLITTVATFVSSTEVTMAMDASSDTSLGGAILGTDCGPALQAALDAAAVAGGGAVLVDGTYLLRTSVSLPFDNDAQHLRIVGLGGDTGLLIAGDPEQDMIAIDNVGRLRFESVNFVGTPLAADDCRRLLFLRNSFVRVYGCGFFGLARVYGGGAAAIFTEVCDLALADNEFGGCVFSSGRDNAVVDCRDWVGFSSERDRFIDYGLFQGAHLSKTGIAFSTAWIRVTDQKLAAANATGQSAMRVVDSRFDEGTLFAIAVSPSNATRVSRVVLDGVQVNNTLLGGGGAFYVVHTDHLVIQNAGIGWVEAPHNFLQLNDCGDVLLDRVQLSGGATGILATAVRSIRLVESPGVNSFTLANVASFNQVVQGAGGVAPFTKYGRVTDSDFEVTPPVGTIAYDLSADKLYVRGYAEWIATPALAPSTDPTLGLINLTPQTGTLVASDQYRKTAGTAAWGNSSANRVPTVNGSFRMRIIFLSSAADTYVRAGALQGPASTVSDNNDLRLGLLQNVGNQVYIVSYGGFPAGPFAYVAGQECVLTYDAATGATVLTIADDEVYSGNLGGVVFEHRFASSIYNVGGEFQLLEYAPL